MLNRFVKYFFLSMAFTPLWGYIVRGLGGIQVAIVTIYGNISLLLLLMLILKKGIRKLYFPKFLFPIFLLAIYISIWDFFNGNVEEKGFLLIFFRNLNLFTIATIILIVNCDFSDGFINKLLFLLKLTIIPALIVSIIQAKFNPLFLTDHTYLKDSLAYLDNPYEMRPPSIFGFLDANDFGLSFIPILSIIISYSMLMEKKRIVSYLLIFMGGISCVLTNGRYIIIGFIMVLSQILLYFKLNFKRVVSIFIATSLASILILAILSDAIGYNLKEYYNERIMSGSASTRILAVQNFIKFFPHNPIFGTGVRVSDELKAELAYSSSQIHVGFLSVFFEYGLVGGILTLIYWYQILVYFYHRAKMTHFWGAVFGFLSFLFANLTMVQYYIYFYGIIFLFIFDSYFQQKQGDQVAKLSLRVT